MTVTVRINMWSSPRNLSTAMMYSWRQRDDITVVDEPLYAHYLRTSGRDHPGTPEVLASQINDGQRVINEVILGDYDTPVVFFKQMAKHLVGLDQGFLLECHNILLTRDPHDMLTSLQVQLPDATLNDTGFPEMIEILGTLLAVGQQPIVIDTKALLARPTDVLGQVCERLELRFEDAMLTWPAGPKPEDGVWAPHWYDSVHRSTGWQPYVAKDVPLLDGVVAAYEQSLVLYEQLAPFQIS